MKYRRKLTEEERKHINEMSARSPRLAAHNAEVLRTQSYHIGGRIMFFTPPDTKNDTTPKAKERPLKRKRFRMPKISKLKGKLVCPGLEKKKD